MCIRDSVCPARQAAHSPLRAVEATGHLLVVEALVETQHQDRTLPRRERSQRVPHEKTLLAGWRCRLPHPEVVVDWYLVGPPAATQRDVFVHDDPTDVGLGEPGTIRLEPAPVQLDKCLLDQVLGELPIPSQQVGDAHQSTLPDSCLLYTSRCV